MPDRAPIRVCPMCRARSTSLHCERDGTGTFQVDNIDVLGASRLRAGDLIAQRYRVIRRIGRGGMGAVYEAEHTGSGQRVAVKVLALEPDEAGGAEVFFRFYREARITASLKHANTVRLFDFGQSESGALFMAMELLHGPTLQQLVARRVAQGGVLTAEEAVAVALPILRSLREAHQAGLVHRDLKPDNIMLAEQGDEDIAVKVLDFGIARSGDSQLTSASHVVGTPAYMSPEQCLGAPLDGRSDLYALGVLLYFCLSGVTPFRGDAVAQIRGHCDGTPPKLASVARTPIPDALLAVVERAMAKVPGDRYADAKEMREALEQSVAASLTITRTWLALTPAADQEPPGQAQDSDIENAPTIAAATPVTGQPEPAAWLGTRSYRRPQTAESQPEAQEAAGPDAGAAAVAPANPPMADAALPAAVTLAAAAPSVPAMADLIEAKPSGTKRWPLALAVAVLVVGAAATLAWSGDRSAAAAGGAGGAGQAPGPADRHNQHRPADPAVTQIVPLPEPNRAAAPGPAGSPTAEGPAPAEAAAVPTQFALAQEATAATAPAQAPAARPRPPRAGAPRPKKQPVIEEIR